MRRWMILPLMLGAMLFALPVWADTVSDSLKVFDANGKLAYSVSVNESAEDPNEIYYINVTGLADASNTSATTLLEADGSYSDIFGVAYVNGDYYLAFNSDTEAFQAAYGGQGTIFLPEGNGGPFDATAYLAPTLRADGYTAQFLSDGDRAVVPEPETWCLLCGGVLLLASVMRRKLS